MCVDLDATVRDLAPRVLQYCRARTGDAGLAEEVAQESLTALVRRWRRLGPPDSPAAFVFAIARRRAGRAAARRRLWAPIEELLGARDGRPTPEEQALASSRRVRFVRCLARLPRRDREALLLVAAGGLGTNDAAAALGISPSALKMRTLRARSRLRVVLENPHDG